MEWEVWLADGTTRDSARHTWEEVPDGVICVWWWDGPRKGFHWGDSIYGHPSTWKGGRVIADGDFHRIMENARGYRNPPSQR